MVADPQSVGLFILRLLGLVRISSLIAYGTSIIELDCSQPMGIERYPLGHTVHVLS